MTTADPPPPNNSSPRLSFSLDLNKTDNPFSPRRPTPSPSSDPDFNFSIEIAAAGDPSPADELFCDGRILPMPLKPPTPNPNPNPDLQAGAVKEKCGGKKSLWKFGRSTSLNRSGSGSIKSKLLRSYSTGSGPAPSPNPKPQQRPAKSWKKSYRHVGGDNRTNSVPLFPKQKGVIGFLMCNCVGNSGNKGTEYYCSP